MSYPPTRITVDLTVAEIRVLKSLIDAPFDREPDALTRVVGTHHHQIKTAHRVREKVLQAIDRRDTKSVSQPRRTVMPKSAAAKRKVTVEETLSLDEQIRRGDFNTKLQYPDRKDPDYTNLRRRYHEDEGRLIEKFKLAAFQEFGVTDNPKRDLCWQKAWEHGHSAGLAEVYTYFQDFVELIQ